MNCTVQNKNRKQQQIRNKTFDSAIKTFIQDRNTKQHQTRRKNLDNIAYSKIRQKESKQRHTRRRNLDIVTNERLFFLKKALNNIKLGVEALTI